MSGLIDYMEGIQPEYWADPNRQKTPEIMRFKSYEFQNLKDDLQINNTGIVGGNKIRSGS